MNYKLENLFQHKNLARLTGTDPAMSCVTGKQINLLLPTALNLLYKIGTGEGIRTPKDHCF